MGKEGKSGDTPNCWGSDLERNLSVFCRKSIEEATSPSVHESINFTEVMRLFSVQVLVPLKVNNRIIYEVRIYH